MIKEKMTCIPYHAENTSIHIITFNKTQLFHEIAWDGVVDKTSTSEQVLVIPYSKKNLHPLSMRKIER